MISDNEECAKASPLPGKKLFGNENNKFKVCVSKPMHLRKLSSLMFFLFKLGFIFLDEPLKINVLMLKT